MFRPSSLSLILLSGGLIAFGPLSTDMYVPALPSMSAYFGTSPSVVNLTLSLYLVGFAIGQLVYGPVSDRFGRRPALLVGLSVYFVSTCAVMLSPTIETLIVARFFQALGACSGQVIGRAIIRDLHDREGSTRMLAYATVVMGLTSAVSPTMGGFISVWLSWRLIFVLLAVYGLVIGVLVWRRLPEPIARLNPHAIQPLKTMRNFGFLLRDRAFAGYLTSLCFMFAGMFSFIAGGSFVFQEVLGLKPQEFGLVFTAMAATFIVGSLITGRVSRRIDPHRIYGLAISGAALGAVLVAIIAASGPGGAVVLVLPWMLVTFCMGFVMPLGYAAALAPHPQLAGTASALLGASQSAASAFAGYLAGKTFDGTALPMGLLIGTFTTLAFVTFFLIVRRTAAEPAAP